MGFVMTNEVKKVAPVGGGFHVSPAELPPATAAEPPGSPSKTEEVDQGDCDACNRK
jgi:hypothetical protein